MCLNDDEAFDAFRRAMYTYLVFLAHVAKTERLTPSNKIPYFTRAKKFAKETDAQVQNFFYNLDVFVKKEKERNINKFIKKIVKALKAEQHRLKKIITIDTKALFKFDEVKKILADTNTADRLSQNDLDKFLSFENLVKDSPYGR